MRPSDVIYSVATGPEHRRKLLTPVGLIVFSALLLAMVFAWKYRRRVPMFVRRPRAGAANKG